MNEAVKSHLVADLFDAVLEEHGRVSGAHGVGVADVHFVHAWPMLAVVAFDFDASVSHHACDAPQQVLVGARLADGVAVEPRVQGRQVGSKVFVAQADHVLAEEAKLQFGGGQRLKAHGACPFDHPLQDVARRDASPALRARSTGRRWHWPRGLPTARWQTWTGPVS